MDDLNLKHPYKFKKYRKRYGIHQRDLGISVKEFSEFEVGDFIEAFSIEEIAQTL